MTSVAAKVQETLSNAAEALDLRKLAESLPGSGARKEAKAVDPTLPGNPASKKADIGNVVCLWNPYENKGTSFDVDERWDRGLHGLLPPAIEDLSLQADRVMYQINNEASHDLERYVVLQQLAASNTLLYYYTIIHNLKRLAPIIYTPTVGEACQQFDRIYSNSLGMYFDSFQLRGKFRKLLDNWPSKNVQIIVVTDGGRILGLGDLGANGMGIPIGVEDIQSKVTTLQAAGKVSLYVAGGGFHPEHSLPATLDVGTDNKELLDDKYYLGNKRPRIGADEHMAVVEEFCLAVQDKWPHCLVQFEDFQTDRAFAILERMRHRMLCFNDDIQGTAAVVVAGLINGLKGQKTKLSEARFLFYGAGSSAVGVAELLMLLLQKEGKLSPQEARKQVWAMDSKGIVTTDRGDDLPSHKTKVAREDGFPVIKDLLEAVKKVKPNALIGLTGRGPAFKQDVVEALCEFNERPLIMALSNPTSKAEITAENAIQWSRGKAIFTSGSPFDPVKYEDRTIEIGQANNVLIFPGVGFGAVMSKAKYVEDSMFLAAAEALADHVDADRIANGTVYPELENLREVSAVVAASVVEEAMSLGTAQIERPSEGILAYVKSRMWHP